MSLVRHAHFVIVAASLLAIAGCRCGNSVSRPESQLRVSVTDGSSVTERATIDFGEVRAGSNIERVFRLENAGRAELTLTSVEVLDGAAVSVDGDDSPGAIFGIEALDGIELRSGEARQVRVRVRGAATAQHAEVKAHRALIRIVPTSGQSVEVDLSATVFPDACDVPDSIDFGVVWTGDSKGVELKIAAASRQEETEVHVSPIRSQGAPAFFSPVEALSAPPGGEVSIPFWFSPAAAREHNAFVDIRRSERCEPQQVRLTGRAIAQGVVVAPVPVDFGFVPPGLSLELPVQVKNMSGEDVVLGEFTDSGPFKWKRPTTSVVIPPGESSTMWIVGAPMEAGAVYASLSMATSFARQPVVPVPARIIGGGPDITAEPGRIDFGRVAVLQDASVPVVQRRSLFIWNTGNPVPDASGHLHLGRPVDGKFGPPYVDIVPRNSGTRTSEFSVTIRGNYDPSTGLPAVSDGGRPVEVEVQLAPDSPGSKEADLVIYSNDLDEPEFRIPVSAVAVAVAGCEYDIAPSHIDFGTVSFPGTASADVRIMNTADGGVEPCFVSLLGVYPPDGEFKVSGGPTYELVPGEQVDVPVRFAPQPRPDGGTERVVGEVEFSISSRTAPLRVVSLAAHVAPACLTAIPQPLDLGTVRLGCRSPARRLEVFNSCSVPIGVGAPRLDQGSAGANCPSCAPFSIVSSEIGDGGTTLAPFAGPVSIDLRFQPVRLGDVRGAAIMPVHQYDGGVDAVISLWGRGSSAAIQEDVFQQSSAPKLDVVVSYQPVDYSDFAVPVHSLEENVTALGNLLWASPIDFRIGVTFASGAGVHSDWESTPPEGIVGRFVTAGVPQEPFLGRSSARFSDKLRDRFYFIPRTSDPLDPLRWIQTTTRISGCFESISRSISPPRSTNENAGFIRSDAGFLGICATLHDDCSPWGTAGTVEPLLNSYWRLVAARKDVSAITISSANFAQERPVINNCVPEGNPSRASLMARLTGGQDTTYWGAMWATELKDSIYRAAGLPREFVLSTTPDTAAMPIEVLVDGVSVPMSDSNGTTWRFDPHTNSIVFGDARRPAPGSEVRVRYGPACS